MLNANDIVNCAKVAGRNFPVKPDVPESPVLEAEFYGDEDVFFERGSLSEFGLYEQDVMKFTGDGWILCATELLTMSDAKSHLENVLRKGEIGDFDRVLAEQWLSMWQMDAPEKIRGKLAHPERLNDREILEAVFEVADADNENFRAYGRSLMASDPDETFLSHGMHFMQNEKGGPVRVCAVCYPAGEAPSDGFADWPLQIPERKFRDPVFMGHLMAGLMGENETEGPKPRCAPSM